MNYTTGEPGEKGDKGERGEDGVAGIAGAKGRLFEPYWFLRARLHKSNDSCRHLRFSLFFFTYEITGLSFPCDFIHNEKQ